MDNIAFVLEVLTFIIPGIYAITLHEAAHGLAAKYLGDKTAYMLGRVSVNPFKHIDAIGTIIVPIMLLFLGGFIFGWAKPVPVNEFALKNRKRDMVIVALAGPSANILMAIFWALLLRLSIYLHDIGIQYYTILYAISHAGIMINIIIGIFNLLPIPPLDGSKVAEYFMSKRLQHYYRSLEQYGFLILLALIISGYLSIVLGPIVRWSFNTIYELIFMNI